MAARIAALLILLLAACRSVPELPLRVALLAPFEGRYREIGYSALYPARLAAEDSGVALLAVDDGGTVESAAERARALTLDPQIKAVVALGFNATDPSVQTEFGDLPVLVVGYWDNPPEQVYMLVHPDIPSMLSESDQDTGSHMLATESFRALNPDREGLRIVTSGGLPNATFRRRTLDSDPFAAEPGLLGKLVYDAVQMVAAGIPYDRFANGYWLDAPINTYQYDKNGVLVENQTRQ